MTAAAFSALSSEMRFFEASRAQLMSMPLGSMPLMLDDDTRRSRSGRAADGVQGKRAFRLLDG